MLPRSRPWFWSCYTSKFFRLTWFSFYYYSITFPFDRTRFFALFWFWIWYIRISLFFVFFIFWQTCFGYFKIMFHRRIYWCNCAPINIIFRYGFMGFLFSKFSYKCKSLTISNFHNKFWAHFLKPSLNCFRHIVWTIILTGSTNNGHFRNLGTFDKFMKFIRWIVCIKYLGNLNIKRKRIKYD